MHPEVQHTVHAIIRDSGVKPRRALEVGGLTGAKSLLRFAELEGAERYCVNLVELPDGEGIKAVTGDANDMSMFEDGSFDLIVSNATLEHDKHFWLSLAEMHRLLAPGGLLILGAPGYVSNPARDHGRSTHTYRVHYRFDYYRFSEQAFRDVFFDGLEDVEVGAILLPPRLIGCGFGPGGDGGSVDRRAAARALISASAAAPPTRATWRRRLRAWRGRVRRRAARTARARAGRP